GVEAELTKGGNQVSPPAINVLLLNPLAQTLHAGGSFFRLHFQGITDGISCAFNIIWIYQHSITQLTSSPGKAAEDQNSLFIIASGDKLLSYEVHSIMQGRD